MITGCDAPEQFSRNLFENRPCITSPVDYMVVRPSFAQGLTLLMPKRTRLEASKITPKKYRYWTMKTAVVDINFELVAKKSPVSIPGQ